MTAAEIEQLILDHMQMVEPLARQAAKRLPACVELDEMISAGQLGLVQAANRYDPELHPSFQAFARLRVFGAIIDSVRYYNWPRRYEEMPLGWMQGGITSADDGEYAGQTHNDRVPPQLIDSQALPDAALIQREEEDSNVICITRARQRLTRLEGRTLDAQLNGNSLRAVGKQHHRSPAWAHYTVQRAKTKLRNAFDEADKAA